MPEDFYANPAWDEAAWIDVIAIEYERLTETYPFDQIFAKQLGPEAIRLLDVGCGTGIFPTYLSRSISSDVRFSCDLLDRSRSSLRQATVVLERLDHFQVSQSFQIAIEDIPAVLPGDRMEYEVIWAIHSFTTVDIARMSAVFKHLFRLLAPGGIFFIYQLTAQASYQRLHSAYRARHPDVARFMEFEDSVKILDMLGIEHQVHPLQFDHQVPHQLLQDYLRKCVLDDSLDGRDFFAAVLPEYLVDGSYRFPQSVNLLTISKP